MNSNDSNIQIMGIIAIIAGVLVIIFPEILAYVVGLVLIIYGTLSLLKSF